MDYLASTYYRWYLQGGSEFVLVEFDPKSIFSHLFWLVFFAAVCVILFAGTAFEIRDDRYVALKTLCIAAATLAFAVAVHWIQRMIFLDGLAALSKSTLSGRPVMISLQTFPMTTPFVVIMAGQLVFFSGWPFSSQG